MRLFFSNSELKSQTQLFIICLSIFLATGKIISKFVFILILAADDGDLEPFEPFAFELETDDEIGFTSNHKHALIGTQRPVINLGSSEHSIPEQFPINSGAAKVASLVPDSAKLSKQQCLNLIFDWLFLEHEKSKLASASQEFQRDSSHEKVNNDRVVTSTEFLLDPNLNTSKSTENGQQLCDLSQDIPTFIKHSRVVHKYLPKMIKKMDSLSDCAQNCRNKMTINGEQPFECHGFTFLGRHADNECEFYENHVFVSFAFVAKRLDFWFFRNTRLSKRIDLPISSVFV